MCRTADVFDRAGVALVCGRKALSRAYRLVRLAAAQVHPARWILVSLPGIRVHARYRLHHPAIGVGRPLVLLRVPRQQRPRVHVVVDQHPPIGVSPVAARAVQQVAVEEDHGAGLRLHRLLAQLVEAVAFRTVVELVPVPMVTLRIQVPLAVRPRKHPQAAVVDRRVVHGDPGPEQGSVPCRDVDLVLMPRLALKAGRLDEVHRLHALDAAVPARQVRAGDLGEDAADLPVPDEVEDYRADVVRLMDAQDRVEHLLVAGVSPFMVYAQISRVTKTRPEVGTPVAME